MTVYNVMHISSLGTTDVGNIEGVNEGVILDTEHICMIYEMFYAPSFSFTCCFS